MSEDAIFSGWTDGMIRCHLGEVPSELLWTIAYKGRGVSAPELSHNQRFSHWGDEGEVRIGRSGRGIGVSPERAQESREFSCLV